MLSDLERLHVQLYGRWIEQTRIPRETFVFGRARALLKAWELTMQADEEVQKLLADRLGPYPERHRQANG
jgi:peroxiredoxin